MGKACTSPQPEMALPLTPCVSASVCISQGVFEREFWTNTPGELALVWDFKGEQGSTKSASEQQLSALDKKVAGM